MPAQDIKCLPGHESPHKSANGSLKWWTEFQRAEARCTKTCQVSLANAARQSTLSASPLTALKKSEHATARSG